MQLRTGAAERDRARLEALSKGIGIPFEVELADGQRVRHGEGTPRFKVAFADRRVLYDIVDEFSFGDAYVQGRLDIEGDLYALFDLREQFLDRFRFSQWLKLWYALLFRSPQRVNKDVIGFHYELDDDFFLSFLDRRFHLYTHGLFRRDEDSLEDASERKLEVMFDALQLRPGMHVLDVGAGWGGLSRYCVPRGIKVTSLTIAQKSYDHMRALNAELNATGEVLLEDFLSHRPAQPYDAVAILGVVEHMPNYRLVAKRLWEVLKPEGRVYFDATASKMRWDVSHFIRKYIYPGTHTNLSLQDLVRELLLNGLRVLEVKDESRDYSLTMRNWAERFDERHEPIAERYGEPAYRAQRMFLWGGAHAHHIDSLQAYHVVAARGPTRGPRPGLGRRIKDFAREELLGAG